MERKLTEVVTKWHLSGTEEKLLITGTRQTGKTTLVRSVASKVPQFLEINLRILKDRIFFEENFSACDFFERIFRFKNAEPDIKTVLFTDDISESPNAVKWFGSVVLPEKISLIAASPNEVENHHSLRLFPFSFKEFLSAMDEKEMESSFAEIPYPPHDFLKLKSLFHLYTLIGGMPEIVIQYSKTRELADLAPVYEKIQDIFEDEIDNSALSHKIRERGKLTLQNAFPFASERISFRNFAGTETGSRETSRIFRLLQQMLLLDLVYPVTDNSGTGSKLPSPRLHLPDTGLVNYFTAVQKQVFESSDLMSLFNGQIIRHITGQEIAASGNKISFWTRAKPQSDAEVDFVIDYEGIPIPVVVKSGEPGRLRSLFQYMDRANHNFAVRIWDQPVQVRETRTLNGKKFFLLSLPYFLSAKIKEYMPGFVKLAVGSWQSQ